MALTPWDEVQLARALALAETSIGRTEPNPRVGCVIGHADGRVLGEGATQEAGGHHAEIQALHAAQAAGHRTQGATAWVTLEPCAHHGRTPPCCDALVRAGLARVVVACIDPFPQVAGEGLRRLRAAGLEVELAEGPLALAAQELNIGFFSRVQRGLPWVRLKVAMSLDGRTALPNGRSQWITGEAARRDGHVWRRRAGAVLTGLGTVLDDDPRLDVRWVPTPAQPLRVVADSRLRMSAKAAILAPPGRVRIYARQDDVDRRRALEAAGAEVRVLAGQEGPHVELGAMLSDLAASGINELHVEAGATLNGALLAGDWVDEVLVYAAPLLLGPGRPMATLPALDELSQAKAFRLLDSHVVGEDLRLRLRRQRELFASKNLTASTHPFPGGASLTD